MFSHFFHGDDATDVVSGPAVGANHFDGDERTFHGDRFVAGEHGVVGRQDGGPVKGVVAVGSFESQSTFQGDGAAGSDFRFVVDVMLEGVGRDKNKEK